MIPYLLVKSHYIPTISQQEIGKSTVPQPLFQPQPPLEANASFGRCKWAAFNCIMGSTVTKYQLLFSWSQKMAWWWWWCLLSWWWWWFTGAKDGCDVLQHSNSIIVILISSFFFIIIIIPWNLRIKGTPRNSQVFPKRTACWGSESEDTAQVLVSFLFT